MRRAFIPVIGIAGAALALAVVAGTFAANGTHTPIGSGPGTNGGRGGPAFATATSATTLDGAAATTIPTAPTVAAGTTLTADQASALQAMAEEEKLALEVYTALGRTWTRNAFANVARAEANHLLQVRTLLGEYGVTDPTAGLEPGSFATPETSAIYSKLVASGLGSEAAALAAGRAIELGDIAHLDAALAPAGLPSDVALVYSSLRSASYQHLATFDRLLGR